MPFYTISAQFLNPIRRRGGSKRVPRDRKKDNKINSLATAILLIGFALVILSSVNKQAHTDGYAAPTVSLGSIQQTDIHVASEGDAADEPEAVSSADSTACIGGDIFSAPYESFEDETYDSSSSPEVTDLGIAIPAYIRMDRLNVDKSIVKPLKNAHVSSLFGYRQNPVSGAYTFHSGYDLAAPNGTKIYAMLDGSVTTAAFDNGYGNYVVLDHGDGLQTLYAHCSKLEVKPGKKVKAGDVIARVGSTGNSTGSHLHVEFRKDNQRYDPEWILGGIYE